MFEFEKGKLVSNVNEIKDNFNFIDNEFELAYSIKANYSKEVLICLAKLNVSFDCASLFELNKLLSLKIPSNKIWVSTPFLSEEFMQKLVAKDVLVFIDSIEQLQNFTQFTRLDHKVKIGLRLSLPNHKSRFGIECSDTSMNYILEIVSKNKNLHLSALSMHYSPKDRDIEQFKSRVSDFTDVFNRYFSDFDINHLNFGGGFAGRMDQRMKSSFKYNIPTWKDYGDVLKQIIIKKGIQNKHISIEPGMAMVADCFDYRAEVLSIKITEGTHYALLSTSSLFLKPTNHTRPLIFDVINKTDLSGNDIEYTLAGISCMEKDVLGFYKGKLDVGDVFIFKNVGAYTTSFRENFIFETPRIYSMI